jgi:hypothetical protein
MMKCGRESSKQDVIEWLVVNRDSIAHLASSVITESLARRALFMDFLPDLFKARDEKIKIIIVDEISSAFTDIDRDTIEDIIGDIDVYEYATGEKSI